MLRVWHAEALLQSHIDMCNKSRALCGRTTIFLLLSLDLNSFLPESSLRIRQGIKNYQKQSLLIFI